MKSAKSVYISALLLVWLGSSYSLAVDREKVEEGRYALLKNGAFVAGSEHVWMLWRLPDGRFELEDHFEGDKTGRALFGSILTSGARMSPEFRKSLQESIAPSDLFAIFDPNHQLLSLTVRGLKLNGDKGVGLECKTSSANIECNGTSDKAKLRIHEPRGLFWWYGIPMLLRSCFASTQGSSSESGPRKIAILSFGSSAPGASWGDKPALKPGDLTISNLGLETLVIGDRSIRSQKYKLEVRVEKGSLFSLTAWTDAKGVVLAVQDESSPGNLISLVQYKNYSSSPASAPLPPER